MNILDLAIPDVKLIQLTAHSDLRGYFLETFQKNIYEKAGIPVDFVQDNISVSGFGVLRGLHYQLNHVQGKLITVLKGQVYDVVVDLRKQSQYFGSWVGGYLSDVNPQQLWVPPGFAHGFLSLSAETIFSYKCTDYYDPLSERTLLWCDSEIGIIWPKEKHELIISTRDANGTEFRYADAYI